MRTVTNIAFIAFVILAILYLSSCNILDGQAAISAGDKIIADVNDVGAAADTLAPVLPDLAGTAARVVGGVAAGLAAAWVVMRRKLAKQAVKNESGV